MSRHFNPSAYIATYPANTPLADTPVGKCLAALQQDPILSRNKMNHSKIMWKLKQYIQTLNDNKKFEHMNVLASQLLQATEPKAEVPIQPFDQTAYMASFPAGTLFGDTPVGKVLARFDRLEAKAPVPHKVGVQARKTKVASNFQGLLSSGNVQQLNAMATRLYSSLQSRTEQHLQILQSVLQRNAGTYTTTPATAPTAPTTV